jgi:hypothetical protein
MSKENGFLQLRRGVFEHVRDGRMSLADYAIHSYITSQADTRSGVWMGSAGALAGELSLSPRMARRFLERLSQGDYIKRFPAPGRHVCYPILVHKFAVTDGEHKGEQLNAIASISPVDLRYFSGEHMGEQRGEHMGEHVSSQKILETGNGKQETREGAPAAPSLSVFACEHFSVSQKQDAKLAAAFPWIDRQAEYRKADSWLEANPERRPKKAKGRFLHNWFSRISQPKEAGNGKAIESRADNLRGIAKGLGLTPERFN